MQFDKITKTVLLIQVIVNSALTYAEYHQEQKLIVELNEYFKFDHNIFLFDSSVDFNSFMSSTNDLPGPCTPQSLYVYQSNGTGNVVGLEILTEITSKNIFLIVVPGTAEFPSITNLLSEVRRIQQIRIQVLMKIGIFFPQRANDKDLRALFQWSWRNTIPHIFAATPIEVIGGDLNAKQLKSMNVFTYNPFGTFRVMNVTGSRSYGDFFLKGNSNFQQYPLELFRELSPKDPSESFDIKVWSAVFRVLNASSYVRGDNIFNSTKINKDDHREIMVLNVISRIARRELAYWVDMFYPLYMQKVMVIVPEALPIGEFVAYLRAVSSNTILGYSIITFVAIIVFLSFLQFKRRKKFRFFDSTADVLNLLMNDNGYIKYRQLSNPELFVVLPLTFVGLIIVNGLMSAVQSYVTRPILQHQIDTIDELYNSPLITCDYIDYETNETRDGLTYLLEREDWGDRIYVCTKDNPIWNFNRSHFAVFDLDTANYLVTAQKRLNIKGYHITNIHYTTDLLTYQIIQDFPFVERVNEIHQWLLQSGLFEMWMEEANFLLELGVVNNYRKNFPHQNREDADMQGTVEMPMFVAYGWIASIITLVIEIIWSKMTPMRMETFKTFVILKFRQCRVYRVFKKSPK